MKPYRLTGIGILISFICTTFVLSQVSSFPYSQNFSSDPLGGDWTVSNDAVGVPSDWAYSATNGNPGGTLTLAGYSGVVGSENYLDLVLNTTGLTFSGGEDYSYQIYVESGALGDATIIVQENSSGTFADIAGTTYVVSSLAGDTWVNKSVALPSSVGNKASVTIRLKISNSDAAMFGNLRFDNASIFGGALPVELTSFSASVKSGKVYLAWKTATEINNAGFEVEKSHSQTLPLTGGGQGGGQWTQIGFVEGAGTSNAPKEYSFVDATISGTVLYRLKQIDRDGKFEYSNSIEVEAVMMPGAFELLQNYPNPFNPTTTIKFAVPAGGHARLIVFNAAGQTVATLFNGPVETGRYYPVTFDALGLASGVYFSQLEFNGTMQLKKMLLMK